MKKFKKPLSLVLVLTMIASMFSVIDFSLFASAEDSVTTVTYTEDFENEISAKENWEIKNLLEGSVTQVEGYASKFKFVTPWQESKSLQPLYYVYDKDKDTYTERSTSVQDSFNATAFMFKSDVAPDNFSKKTITGSLKMYLGTCSGGGQFTNIYNRLVIGYDDNGNPVSVTIGRESNDLKVVPLTYVKASDGKIYNSANNNNEMWHAHLAGMFSFNPGQTSSNGSWGPTINYEIVITPNADGKHYDTEVTFTNPSATALNESNDTTYTDSITATSVGKIATVSSFGINVLPDKNAKDDNKSAYDNIKIVYEVPSKAAANFIAEWEEEFGDGSQYAVESQIDSFLEEYNAAKNALDENIKNAIEDTVFLAKVEAVKASLSATVSFSTAASADFEKTKENSILSYSKSDYFTWTNNATTLSKHNANGWGLSSMVYHKDGTSASPYYYYTQTLLHPKDVKNGTAYRNYTDEVIAPPKSADFYYTYGIYGETNWAAWQHGEWVGVNYAISPTVVSSVKTNITDGEENTVTVTGTKYQTTLYMAEFRIAFLNTDSASEPILANRTFKRKITEIVYSEEDLVQYGEYGLSNSTSSLADSNALYQGTQNSPEKPTIASLLVEGSNNPYEDGALFADIYKLLKVNLSYENDDPSKPVFTIVGKYDTETETGKEFTMKLAPTQTVTSGSERAFGFYTDGERKMSTYGGFADPVVTYDYSKVYAELASAELYNEFCESYADTFSATAEDVKNGSVTLETLNSFLKDYAELSAAYQQQVKENGYYDHMVLLRIAALKNSVLAEADFDNETVENAVVSSGVRYVEGYNGKKAAYFDDSAKAYVDFGNVALGENSFAVSYWFKTDVVLTTEGTIFANDSGITVTNTSVSKTTVNAKIGENEAVTLSDIQSVGDTRWHSVIISVNRSGKLSVYVDGELAFDVSGAEVYETDISALEGSLGTGKFVLGANTEYGSGLAKAAIDEFKIYSDYITADEALAMYNCEKLGAKINEIENKMANYKAGTRFTQEAIDNMNTALSTAKAVVVQEDCSNADAVSAAYDTLKAAFESFLVGKEAIKTVQLASDTHIWSGGDFVYSGSLTTEEEKFLKRLTETKNGELGFNVDTYLNAGDLSQSSGTIAQQQAFAYYENYLPDNTLVVQAMGNHDLEYSDYGDTSGLYREAGFIDNLKKYVDASNKYNQSLAGEDGKISTAYYYATDGDIHYIALTSLGQMKDAELNWLKGVMKEIVKDGKPIFIVSHYGPDVHDHNPHIPRNKEVIKVIDYSQVYLFYGHNHLSFGNKTAYTGYSTYAKNATFFNLPPSGKADSKQGYENSAYYYLFYYEDQMVLRARDSMTNEWITEFDIELDIDLGAQILKSGNSIIADIANDTLSVNSTNADTVKANANAALTAYNNADADTQAEVDSLMGIDVDDKLTYTVKYADVVEAVVKPSLLGTQLKKVTDVNAVDFRYAIEYIAGTESSDYSIAGYGAVVVPNQVRTDKAADITTSVKVEEGKEDYISNVYVTADTVKVDSNNRYYVAVTGSKGKLGTLFDCRPYIIYKDSEGTEYIVYAENEKSSTDGTNVTNGQASTCCLFVTKTLAQRMVNTLGESCVFTDMGESYDTLAEMKTAIDKIGQKGDSKPTTDDRAAYFKFIYLNNSAYEAAKGDTNNENV